MNNREKEQFKREQQINAAETRQFREALEALKQEYESNIWKRFIHIFKGKRNQKYHIKIVYAAKQDFADKLRKLLVEQGHDAFAIPLSHFEELPTNLVDYTIYIDNCDTINRTGEKVLLDKFGCLVSIKKSQIIISYDEDVINNASVDAFASYYESFMQPINSLEKYNVIRNSMETKNTVADGFDSMIDKIVANADDIEKKHSTGLSLLYLTASIPRVLIGFGISIPLAVTEELFKDFSDKLKSKLHRKKYVPLCQQQIVMFTICNYFLGK